MSGRPQPGDGLAIGDAFAGDGDVRLQDAGERGADVVAADVAEQVAGLDLGTVGERADGAEHPGGGADDQALGGEQVLASNVSGVGETPLWTNSSSLSR